MSQSKQTAKRDNIGHELKQLAQMFFGQNERLKQIEKSLTEAPKLVPGKVTGQQIKATSSQIRYGTLPASDGKDTATLATICPLEGSHLALTGAL